MVSPTWRLVWRDQLAALAVSLTTRLLSVSPPPDGFTIRVVPAVPVLGVEVGSVPVTVTAKEPVGEVAAVVMVSVVLPPALIELEPKLAVAPVGGGTLTLSAIGPGVPETAAALTV